MGICWPFISLTSHMPHRQTIHFTCAQSNTAHCSNMEQKLTVTDFLRDHMSGSYMTPSQGTAVVLNFQGTFSKVKVTQSCLTICNPMDCSPWNSPGQKSGVGSLSLLQGIFPTQGTNPGLPYLRPILYQLSHQETFFKGLGKTGKIRFQKPAVKILHHQSQVMWK